jgi:hypothetical protein
MVDIYFNLAARIFNYKYLCKTALIAGGLMSAYLLIPINQQPGRETLLFMLIPLLMQFSKASEEFQQMKTDEIDSGMWLWIAAIINGLVLLFFLFLPIVSICLVGNNITFCGQNKIQILMIFSAILYIFCILIWIAYINAYLYKT